MAIASSLPVPRICSRFAAIRAAVDERLLGLRTQCLTGIEGPRPDGFGNLLKFRNLGIEAAAQFAELHPSIFNGTFQCCSIGQQPMPHFPQTLLRQGDADFSIRQICCSRTAIS